MVRESRKTEHTDRTIHGLAPRLLDCASVAILSYSLPMPAGALAGPGREKGALTSSLRAGESFDMVVEGSKLRALVVSLVVYQRWSNNQSQAGVVLWKVCRENKVQTKRKSKNDKKREKSVFPLQTRALAYDHHVVSLTIRLRRLSDLKPRLRKGRSYLRPPDEQPFKGLN